MAETPQEKRQRRAQTALVAIVESSDDPQVKLAELARVRAFLDRCWDGVSADERHDDEQ